MAETLDLLRARRDAVEAAAREADLAAGRGEPGAAREAERLHKVRDVRGLLAAYDDAADALIATDRAAREGIAQLYSEVADGPTRTGELGELPRLVDTMQSVVHERLAHGGVGQTRSLAFDRAGPAPSVQRHFEGAVLTPIAPPAGRPKKPGSDDAAAPAPTTGGGDAGGAVDTAEAAARAAIEKDLAA